MEINTKPYKKINVTETEFTAPFFAENPDYVKNPFITVLFFTMNSVII